MEYFGLWLIVAVTAVVWVLYGLERFGFIRKRESLPINKGA